MRNLVHPINNQRKGQHNVSVDGGQKLKPFYMLSNPKKVVSKYPRLKVAFPKRKLFYKCGVYFDYS